MTIEPTRSCRGKSSDEKKWEEKERTGVELPALTLSMEEGSVASIQSQPHAIHS